MIQTPNYLSYNPQQMSIDRIDRQITDSENRTNELKQIKAQMTQTMFPQQPTNLTQNFQLAPNSQNNMKFVDTIEDVNKEIVYCDTPFFSKDMSVLWIKNIKGEIKSYSIEEIIQKDEKDMQIEYLTNELEKLKKGNKENEKHGSSNDIESTEKQKSTSLSSSSKGK